MFADFTEELATGTGNTLTLTGNTSGNIPFSASFADTEPVSYTVRDSAGIIKSRGIGTYNSPANTITRNDLWNWNGTLINNAPGSNITLSAGVHTVTCSPVSVDAQNAYLSENRHGFIARSSGGTQSIPTSTWVKLSSTTFSLVEYNKNGVFSNGSFTPDKTGFYLFSCLATVSSLQNDRKMIVGLFKNNSLYRMFGRGTVGGTSPDYAGFGGTVRVKADNTTDIYDSRVNQNGSQTNMAPDLGYSSFSALRECGL